MCHFTRITIKVKLLIFYFTEFSEFTYRMPAEDAERRVNSTNSKGCTALHYACLEGHQKVVEKLKDAKADPSAK